MAVVLVVNDDRDMLDVYQALLAEMGHEVVPRLGLEPDPEDVIKTQADALIIDLQRDADPLAGMTVIEELRRHPATRDMPVVLSTGAAAEVRQLTPRLSQLQVPVLIKPFDADQFQNVLRRLVPPAKPGASTTAEPGC
jgi:CheY-like chemotaxis protein